MNSAETYRAIQNVGGIADLTGRLFLRLTGEDRVRYLNGQISNDVRRLTPEAALHACVMTAKGRMSGDVFVRTGPDFLEVDAEAELRDTLPARLERYIIADDVELKDITDTTGMLHILHGDPDALRTEGIQATRASRFGVPGVDLVGNRMAIAARIRELSDGLPIIDAAMLESLRVEAGIPKWGAELGEDTIPVEAGLQHTAISYEKGCYIGQEVISRLKSIGHVNRTLRGLVAVDGDTPLPVGATLVDPANPDRDAGRITSAAYSFLLERPAALGYVKRGVEPTELIARDESGREARRVEVRDLPLIIP